jgi:hypothetical protein
MDPRTDYARISSENAVILELNVLKYLECISKTQMSEGEKKIDFLVRYVPKLRNLPWRLINDFEVFFLKEIVTRGYLILTVNEQSDYLYFIVRGFCKLLYPIENLPHVFGEASLYDA